MGSLADTASGEWVFSGNKGNGPLTKHELYYFWIKTRDFTTCGMPTRPTRS